MRSAPGGRHLQECSLSFQGQTALHHEDGALLSRKDRGWLEPAKPESAAAFRSGAVPLHSGECSGFSRSVGAVWTVRLRVNFTSADPVSAEQALQDKIFPKKHFPAIAYRLPEPMLIGRAADKESAGRFSGAAGRTLRCSSSGNLGSRHLRRQSRLVILLVGIRMAGRAGTAVSSCRKEVVRSRCFALSSTSTSVAFAVRSFRSRRSPVARNTLRRGVAGHGTVRPRTGSFGWRASSSVGMAGPPAAVPTLPAFSSLPSAVTASFGARRTFAHFPSVPEIEAAFFGPCGPLRAGLRLGRQLLHLFVVLSTG